MTETQDFDTEWCECGTRLDVHPPLKKIGPLRSWKSSKYVSEEGSANARLGREASSWGSNTTVELNKTK